MLAAAMKQISLHRENIWTDREALETTLTAEMVSATCQRGYDFHMALAHEHRSRALQFVPGLGPRKAAHLLQACGVRVHKLAYHDGGLSRDSTSP